MSFRAEQAISKQVVLLVGAEEALRRRALAELLTAAGATGEAYDFSSLVADASEPSEWIGAAQTAPFLSERRVVAVRNVLRVTPKEMGPKLSNLPPTALLVLVGDDEAGRDTRKFDSNKAAWVKVVKEAGGVVADFPVEAGKARKLISDELTRRGRKMPSAAIETLLALTGGSASRALDELEKILLFHPNDPVTDQAVLSVAVPSPEWNIWKLLDAISLGQAKGALVQLQNVLSAGKKPEEVALGQILPMLQRQLRLLWQARVCVDAGVSASFAPPHVTLTFPSKPNLAKEADYRQRSLTQTARRVSLEQLAECFRILANADAQLKGLQDAYSATDSLETMVLHMCDAVRSGR